MDVQSIDIHAHVNNQEYLRWMQEIAIEHSSALGWPMERYLQAGASWYVKSHFIDYVRPAVLGDTLIACTWVGGMSERSSPRHTLFLRESDRQIVARAERTYTAAILAEVSGSGATGGERNFDLLSNARFAGAVGQESSELSYTAYASRFVGASLWDDFLLFHYLNQDIDPDGLTQAA